MIIVKLMGGLGNQMFQYAFGKSLSLRLNKELVLDESFLVGHQNTRGLTPRDFELDIFYINEPVIKYERIFGLGKGVPYRINQLLDPVVKHFRKEFIFTDTSSLEDLYTSKPRKIVLEGYFQKEKYFKENESQLREIFAFKKILNTHNQTLADRISALNSVSLHVRRGDYVKDAGINAYHGVCPPDYYKEAIRMISKKTRDAVFFVFSDDIEWCKGNLDIPGEAVFVSHNTGADSYVDMQLMSLCKDHIIANSSFSWWGAWLNPFAEKTVIAPKNWFADNSVDTSGLYPKEWLII
jgi:hypothetical protein